MIDVAIIGAGLMGRWHLAAAKVAGGRITAIVDQDLNAARLLARSAPEAAIAADIADLPSGLARVAHICVPTDLHAPTAVVAASKRMAAFVEKPIAADAQEAQRLYDAAGDLGALVCPVHQYAFQSGLEQVLARLKHLETLRCIAFDIRSAGADAGRIKPNALIADILPHPLSVLQRLRPDIRLADLRWSAEATTGELLCTTQYNGLMISIRTSANARPPCFQTLVIGDRGSAAVDGFHGYAAFSSGRVARSAKLTAPFREAAAHFGAAAVNLASRALRREFAYPGLAALTRRFYSAVAKGDPAASPITQTTAIDNAAARDQLCVFLQASRGVR